MLGDALLRPGLQLRREALARAARRAVELVRRRGTGAGRRRADRGLRLAERPADVASNWRSARWRGVRCCYQALLLRSRPTAAEAVTYTRAAQLRAPGSVSISRGVELVGIGIDGQHAARGQAGQHRGAVVE